MRDPDRPTPLNRFLRLFTDIRAGESGTALLLTLNIFLILTSYLVLKTLRDGLVLAERGAQVKSFLNAGLAILLLGAVPLYGALADRLPRRPLINTVSAFFVLCLVLFFGLASFRVPLGIPFFLWVGIFNLMIIAQFWAFANDVYTTDEGKRLFPVVQFGASAGAVAGAWLAGRLIDAFGVNGLFIGGAVLLALATVVTNVVDHRERQRTERGIPYARTSGALPAATGQYRTATGELRAVTGEYHRSSGEFQALKALTPARPEVPAPTAGPYRLVFQSRYLLLIAVLVVLLNWVNTNGGYILDATVKHLATRQAAGGGPAEAEIIGRFYSTFYTGVNLGGVLIQLFLVSRVLKYMSVRGAILVLPFISLGAYLLLAFVPLLAAIRWAKTAENATDYSLQNTLRAVLFLPTTREEKYKAKQAIDSFFVRLGDMLHAGLVLVLATLLGLGVRTFALVNVGLVALWIVVAVLIGRRYERLAATTAS
jgi:AAA family ATP:ADP antiporter